MPRKKRFGTRSVANSTGKLPELVFFLDESLDSTTLAKAFHDAGAAVERATEHFPRGTEDEIWLQEVGRKQWVVLTRDKRIRYRQLERLALQLAGVRAFVFTGGNVALLETASAASQRSPPLSSATLIGVADCNCLYAGEPSTACMKVSMDL